VEITGKLGLAAKTITNLTRELLSSNVIRIAGYRSSSGGRRQELLELNPDYKYGLGIYLGGRCLEGAIVDLRGGVSIYKKIRVDIRESQSSLLNKIKHLTRELITQTKMSKLFGTGFVFHGILDTRGEMIISSAVLPNLKGVKIKKFFREEFSLPIEVEISSRAIALAEKWFGAARNINDFILLELGMGIGSTIVHKGEIFYGAGGHAGEIGHTVVETNGRMCPCGRRGCLETVASIPAIEKEMVRCFKGSELKNFKELYHLAINGNKSARDIINRAGQYIGIATSNLVNILNPSHLIVSGELIQGKNLLFQTIDNTLRKYVIPSFYDSLQIIPGKLEERATVIGGATLALKRCFEATELN
jgi:predicted NBD/HSP70 family sugar kinase